MYNVLLSLHNIFRWVVLALALWAIIGAFIGWFGKREWTAANTKARTFFVASLDVQFLMGLILYVFLSPFTVGEGAFFDNPGAGMKNQEIRFFGVEHILTGLIALALAHIGAVRSKKMSDPVARHKTIAIFFSISLALILARIPWWRPMLRLFE